MTAVHPIDRSGSPEAAAPATSSVSSGGRSKGLQGLRALFILAVLASHFLVPFRDVLLDATVVHRILYHIANMGWMGVDLFFTLSGFVVTLVLLRTPQSYTTFMARRAWRLLPAYYAMLLVVGIATFTAPFIGIEVRDGFLLNQAWAWTLTANFAAAMHGALLDGGNLSLIPVWSLAVEIQFYLVWPLVIWKFRERNLVLVILSLALAALATRGILGYYETYYNTVSSLTPLRIDQFALGGLGALLAHQRTERRWAPWAAAALLLPLLCRLGLDPSWHKAQTWVHTIGYFWLAAGTSALVLSVYQGTLWKPATSFLSSGPMVAIGDRSYSIYLWHFAFYGLVTQTVDQLDLGLGRTLSIAAPLVAVTALGLLLSEISYRLVERRLHPTS